MMDQSDLFDGGPTGIAPKKITQRQSAEERQAERQAAREEKQARANAAIEANGPILEVLRSIPRAGRTKFADSMIILLGGGKPAHELTEPQLDSLGKVYVSALAKQDFRYVKDSEKADLLSQFGAAIEGVKKAMEPAPPVE